MKWAIAIAILFFIALFAIGLLKQRKPAAGAGYYRKKPLSRLEQVLYYRLVKALPGHVVLSQVSLYQLVGIKKGPAFQPAFKQMSRKSVDFVICTPSFEVVAVIELDDYGDDDAKRKKTDGQKEMALAQAGIKLLRWWTTDLPSTELIVRAIQEPAPV